MLDLFRKQKAASKWILGVITGIMALGMVVFFIPAPTSISDVSLGSTIAKIDNTEVTTGEYMAAFRRFLKSSNYPKDIEFLKQVGVPRQLLDEIISQKLLVLEAQKFGFQASDRELKDRILSYPIFQQWGGAINMQAYSRLLQQSGSSVEEFEASERNQILIDKLRHLITDSIIVTPDEVQQAYRNNNEKVTLEYVLFDPAEIQKTTKVDETELKKYYEAHKQNFMKTEERKVKYLLVDMNKIRLNTRPTDEELKQYYEQNRTRYFVSDRNRVSHILFKTGNKSPGEIEKIRQKALEILAKSRAGADFAQLAREYSEDLATKSLGGDLGWVDQTTPFIPEFKRVALSLGVGAVSDLVTSQFGFHIIKALDHQPAHTQSFEEAKELVRPTLAAQKSDREGLSLANQIYSALASKPNDLEAVAKQFGAEIRETPLFSTGDTVPDIGSNPDFEKKVFSMPLNKVSDPVRVAPGFAIPKVVEIKPPHTPDLAEIRDKIESAYKQEKAAELALQRATEFSKKAESAQNFSTAAKAAGLKAETSEAFKRNANEKTLGSTRDISTQAFSMKVGDTSSALKLGLKLVVFRLKSKEEVKPEEFAKEKDSTAADLLAQKRGAAFQSFQDELLARSIREGRVKVNEKALNSAINRRLT